MPGLPLQHHEPDRRETAYLERWLARPRNKTRGWQCAVMAITIRRIKFAMHVRRHG